MPKSPYKVEFVFVGEGPMAASGALQGGGLEHLLFKIIIDIDSLELPLFFDHAPAHNQDVLV